MELSTIAMVVVTFSFIFAFSYGAYKLNLVGKDLL